MKKLMNRQNDFEKDILKSYENDEWKSVSDFNNLKEEYELYAQHTFIKKKNQYPHFRKQSQPPSSILIKFYQDYPKHNPQFFRIFFILASSILSSNSS